MLTHPVDDVRKAAAQALTAEAITREADACEEEGRWLDAAGLLYVLSMVVQPGGGPLKRAWPLFARVPPSPASADLQARTK